MDKSTSELSALKSAFQDRNDEVKTLKSSLDDSANSLIAVKKQFSESEDARKTLSSKISTLESETSSQKRQLTNLASITKELDTLKGTYKDLKIEKDTLSDQYNKDISDTDNDGIVAKFDKCPSSAAGISVDKHGCADIADADGDKIADTNDLCPGTSANATVNEFGCVPNQNITLKGVNFSLGSDRLTPDSLPIINAAAETLKANPSIKVEVAGYTDNSGQASINLQLSKRRANSVSIQLIKQGIDANRISAKGYGAASPIASNTTNAGRLLNRRVELKIR